MADKSVDMSEWIEGLDRLGREVREKVAFSMAKAGAEVLRDAAKANVDAIPPGKWNYQRTGRLRESIYLHHSDKRSTGSAVTYSVTWGGRNSPVDGWYGKMVEFGHWRKNVVFTGKDGNLVVTSGKLPENEWVWKEGTPFLRPALDQSTSRLMSVMVERGRRRLATLDQEESPE